MKALYLPIEILDRELPSRILMAMAALKKDFFVVISDQNELKANLNNMPAGAIIQKDHTDCNTYDFFKMAKENGFITSALDEEGLVYFNKEHFSRARIGMDCLSVTDIIFAWGDDQFSILKNSVGLNNTKIFNTGNPRFDIHLANRRLRAGYKNKQRILVNTRFGSVNSGLDLDVDGYIERMRLVDEVKTDSDEKFRRLYFEFMSELFEYFIFLIKEICSRFPDCNITVRPHPAESSQPYIDLSEKYSNLNISKGVTLEDDLLNHDLLIHNGCTTGIEALVTGVPTFVYEPMAAPVGDMALPNKFGEIYKDLPSLMARIAEDKEYDFVQALNGLDSFISSLDVGNSYEKIISILSDSVEVEHSREDISTLKIKNLFGNSIKKIISLFPNYMLPGFVIKRKNKWVFVDNKFPFMSEMDLMERIKTISCKKYGFGFELEDVAVKKIGHKTFVLYSNKR